MPVRRPHAPSRMPRIIGLLIGSLASWLIGGLIGFMLYLSIALLAQLFTADWKALFSRSSVPRLTSASSRRGKR